MKTILGTIIGFVTAWLLFELTETRRRWIQRRNFRQALIGELKATEVRLRSTLLRFSSRSEDLPRAVAELRWFHTEGRTRGVLQDLPEGVSEELLAKKDEDIIKVFRAIPPTGANLAGTDFPLPILDGILSAQASFLSANEINSLSDLRWQAHLLASEARSMELWLGMTFTVTDSDNHEIVVQNRRRCEHGYRVRLSYTLDHLLEALRTLNRPGRIKTLFSAKK